MKINRKFWIIGGVAVVVIIAAVAVFMMRSNNRQTPQYQTYKVQRSTLASTIATTGTVRASQSASLSWGTSGTVDEVNAKIGDTVKANQVLATLAADSLPVDVATYQTDLILDQQSLNDLLQSDTGQAQAEQAVADAENTLQTAQNKYDSMFYPRASDEVIRNTQAKINLAKLQVAKNSDTYRHYINKRDGNPDKAQALANLTNAQINLNNLIADYNWYTGHYTQVEIDQAKSALDVAKAQLSDAQRQLNQMQNGPDPSSVASAKAKVAADQAAVNQAKIIAPFDGVITEAEPVIGDVVSSGTAAFRVDNMSQMLVDIQVTEVDINNIKVGQKATIQFDAINGKTYNGDVVKVNQAGDVTSSAVNFTITVQVTDSDAQVKPGMTATVNVITKQVDNALLVPNRAIRTFNNRSVVDVVRNGQLVPVEIQTGITNDTLTEVVGGNLQEGDTIAIVTSGSTSTSGNGGAGGFRGGGGFGGGGFLFRGG